MVSTLILLKTPVELSVSDATMQSLNLELSITILEASFTLMFIVQASLATIDIYNRYMFIVQVTGFVLLAKVYSCL